ncbi:lipase family protein [Nocardia brasiliensis]|uniref:lipase family protein n=1 Tax=Nocardia brasiliensis TaxID=37326 RepID=UPI00245884F9|nr:lipase family protein [Nocardia brasiliensis]
MDYPCQSDLLGGEGPWYVRPSRRRRLAVIMATIGGVLVGMSAQPAGSAHADPAPAVDTVVEPVAPADPFYDLPAGLAAAVPGQILRSRSVTLKALQLLPLDVQAWQLLYRTTAADGRPYAAVTTVLIPRGPATPRPLLSYQMATDSTLRICNPSYGLVNGFPVDPTDNSGPLTFAVPAAEILLAASGLEKGWAVAIPDHGGVDNRFLTPRQPGYAVLDGIRAAQVFEPAGLAGPRTPVGLWGYSGGAIASSWAVEMQPTYAPELDIRGAAFGAPERDLKAAVTAVNGTPLAGLIPLALAAVLKDEPHLLPAIREFVDSSGMDRIEQTRAHCVGQNVLSNPWFDQHQYVNTPLEIAFEDPRLKPSLDSRGVSGLIPTAPLYVYNGTTEEVAPISGTDRLVDSYCAGGTPVVYRREELPPRPLSQVMTTHGTVVITGAPNAFAWLTTRLAPAAEQPSGCDIQTVSTTMVTPQALAAFGPMIASALMALTGQAIGAN